MDSHYASTSSEDYEHPDMPTLQQGESPQPVSFKSRVPTKISLTEVPVPRILTKPDTSAKREAMRKTEHAMNHHPVDEENDVMAHVERIKRGLNRKPVYTQAGNATNSRPIEEDDGSAFEQFLFYFSIGMIVVAGGYLIYKTMTFHEIAEKAVSSVGKKELDIARKAAQEVLKTLKK